MDIRINGAAVQVDDRDVEALLEAIQQRLQTEGVALEHGERVRLLGDIDGLLGQMELSARGCERVGDEIIGRLPGETALTPAARGVLVGEITAALPAPPAPGPVALTDAARDALRDAIVAALPAQAPQRLPAWVGVLLGAILLVAGAVAFGVFNGGFSGHSATPAPIIGGGGTVPGSSGTATALPALATVTCPNPPGGQCLLVQDGSVPGGVRIIPIPPVAPPTPPAPPAPIVPTAPAQTKAQCIALCLLGQAGDIAQATTDCAATPACAVLL